MKTRYILREPHTRLLGVVITKKQREVTRAEYEEAARAHGWDGSDIESSEFAWECREGIDGWVEE